MLRRGGAHRQRRSTRHATRCWKRSKGSMHGAAHQGGSRARTRAAAEEHRAEPEPLGPIGLTLSEFIGAGDWRLYFLHRDRLRKITDERGRQAAAAKYFKPSNRTLGLFIPTQTARSRGDSGDAGRRRAAQGLQGRCRDRRRRGLRSVAGQYRKAHQPERHAVRVGAGAAAEEDARRNRRRAARAAVSGTRQSLMNRAVSPRSPARC